MAMHEQDMCPIEGILSSKIIWANWYSQNPNKEQVTLEEKKQELQKN